MPSTYPYDHDELLAALLAALRALIDDLHPEDPRARLAALREAVSRSAAAADLASRGAELMMGAFCAARGAARWRLRHVSSNADALEHLVQAVAHDVLRHMLETPPPNVDRALDELEEAITLRLDLDEPYLTVAAAFARRHLMTA